jgi:hypothetical protein
MYTKDPTNRIQQLLKFLKKPLQCYSVDDVAEIIEKRFRFGVFVQYGRLIGQVHSLEIYQMSNKYRGKPREMQKHVCTIEVPVEAFRLELAD